VADGAAIIGNRVSRVKAGDASGGQTAAPRPTLPSSLVLGAQMLVQATLRASVASVV